MEKPHVICIQATQLKAQLDFIVPGYSSIRKDRRKRQGEGVITVMQSGLGLKIERNRTG